MDRNSFLVILVVLLTIGSTGSEIRAETRYVSEEFEITLRTGPSVERKIIALIRSGSAVQILDSGEEWTKIRYNNKDGWVLTRYLSSIEPCALTFAKFKETFSELKKTNEELLKKNTNLEAENQRFQSALATHQESLEKINSEYEALKQESADFLALKADYEKTSKELAVVKAKAEKADKEIRQLTKNQNIKWFMAGAGVLILGFIIGFGSRRQRRQSSLLG